MGFSVQVNKADIEASKDGKKLSAVIEGIFLPNSERQHDLLNFILNHEDKTGSAELGALPDGHDGFRLVATVNQSDFFQFMHEKDLAKSARALLFDQTGAQPSDEDVAKVVKQMLQKEAEANLAKQVDEASSQKPASNSPEEQKNGESGSSASGK